MLIKKCCPMPLLNVCQLTCVIGCLALPLAVAAQDMPPEHLGTLLYSAVERSSITQARLGQVSNNAVNVISQVSVNGFVQRQGGKSTAWVNGQPVKEGYPFPPVKRLTTTNKGIQIDGQPVRVGETLDLTTLVRHDIVQPGALTTKGNP
jgi:hypothetical protein